MEIKNLIVGLMAIGILIISGCTKTVYVQPDVCPQKCTTAFYEKYGSCRELLEQQRSQGYYIDFEPEKFECSYSSGNENKCSCHCNCGLGYNFEI